MDSELPLNVEKKASEQDKDRECVYAFLAAK